MIIYINKKDSLHQIVIDENFGTRTQELFCSDSYDVKTVLEKRRTVYNG